MNSKYMVCAQVARRIAGLWGSGFLGSVAGAGLGAIVGGLVGTIVPFYGNIIGAVIGALVGFATGYPAAVIGSVLGTRQGWRFGGGVATLLMGGIAFALFASQSQAGWRALPWWIVLIFAVLVQIGFWSGGVIWDRIETRDGLWEKWRCLLETKGVSHLEHHHLLYAVAGLAPFLLAAVTLLFRCFLTPAH